MNKLIITLLLILTVPVKATEVNEASIENLKAQIIAVNKAQNKVLMHDSTVEDAERLFALYSDDFIYIHEVYGGEYSKAHLFSNTLRYLKSGGYNKIEDRYTVVSMIVGLNAVAVQRKEKDGDLHLAVFEFKGDKVSKITEYWK